MNHRSTLTALIVIIVISYVSFNQLSIAIACSFYVYYSRHSYLSYIATFMSDFTVCYAKQTMKCQTNKIVCTCFNSSKTANSIKTTQRYKKDYKPSCCLLNQTLLHYCIAINRQYIVVMRVTVTPFVMVQVVAGISSSHSDHEAAVISLRSRSSNVKRMRANTCPVFSTMDKFEPVRYGMGFVRIPIFYSPCHRSYTAQSIPTYAHRSYAAVPDKGRLASIMPHNFWHNRGSKA